MERIIILEKCVLTDDFWTLTVNGSFEALYHKISVTHILPTTECITVAVFKELCRRLLCIKTYLKRVGLLLWLAWSGVSSMCSCSDAVKQDDGKCWASAA